MADVSAIVGAKTSRTHASGRTKRLDLVLEVPLTSIDQEDRRFQFRVGSSTIEVADSIRTVGQQVPICLWGRDPHVIIDGFRRVQALTAIGARTAKAILRDDLDENAAFQLSFIENVKRRSWTPFEKALAVRVAVVDRGFTVKQVASELTLSDRQIQRYLQMAEFDPRLAHALGQGRISMAHAALLHRADSAKLPELLADAERLSLETLKRKLRPQRRGRPRSYLSAMGSGFRMSAFQFGPSTSAGDKQRMLAALERAIETIRATSS